MAQAPGDGGGDDGGGDGADYAEPGAGSAVRTWATVAVVLVLLTVWLLRHGTGGGALDTAALGRTPAAAAGDHPARVYAPHRPLPASPPVRIDIGSIGVHARVVPRGLAGGAVDPPPYSTPEVAGWYRGGPSPGAKGAALIVGHVDTETRAAVFYQLSTVRARALVEVTRGDGTVAEFSVEAVEVVQKDHFDADRVYGDDPADRPELRLITCGGTFDRAKQAYSANVVVYAALTGSRPA